MRRLWGGVLDLLSAQVHLGIWNCGGAEERDGIASASASARRGQGREICPFPQYQFNHPTLTYTYDTRTIQHLDQLVCGSSMARVGVRSILGGVLGCVHVLLHGDVADRKSAMEQAGLLTRQFDSDVTAAKGQLARDSRPATDEAINRLVVVAKEQPDIWLSRMEMEGGKTLDLTMLSQAHLCNSQRPLDEYLRKPVILLTFRSMT